MGPIPPDDDCSDAVDLIRNSDAKLPDRPLSDFVLHTPAPAVPPPGTTTHEPVLGHW